MDYTFWERLLWNKPIARGERMPRCDTCRTRMQRKGAPRLFLLPVYNDKSYEFSAGYYAKSCRPLSRAEDIPVGQRACRMWPLACPACGARAVLVVDFLRVRGQEVPEAAVVCEYAPLAGLLHGTPTEAGCDAQKGQAFRYE